MNACFLSWVRFIKQSWARLLKKDGLCGVLYQTRASDARQIVAAIPLFAQSIAGDAIKGFDGMGAGAPHNPFSETPNPCEAFVGQGLCGCGATPLRWPGVAHGRSQPPCKATATSHRARWGSMATPGHRGGRGPQRPLRGRLDAVGLPINMATARQVVV